MKKKFVILILIFFSLFLASCGYLSGRYSLDYVISEGNVVYYDDNSGKILRFSEEGQTKDTIIIQYYRVSKDSKYHPVDLAPFEYWPELESSQLKDLYVPNLVDVNYRYGTSPAAHTKMPNLERLFSASGSDLFIHDEDFKGTQYYPNIGDIKSYEIIEREDGSKDAIANVSYYINPFTYYSDGQKFESSTTILSIERQKVESSSIIYFIDDVDGGKITNIPQLPILCLSGVRSYLNQQKKYCAIVDGWYKEPECINKWDFEKDIVPKKMYDEEGKYLYKETRLYAQVTSVVPLEEFSV